MRWGLLLYVLVVFDMCLCSNKCLAKDISVSFVEKEISVPNNSGIFTNTLHLSNNSSDTLNLQLAASDPGVRIFNNIPVLLLPHVNQEFILKCMLPKHLMFPGSVISFIARLNNGDTLTTSFILKMPYARDVQMSGADLHPVISNPEDGIKLPLLIRNKSNYPEKLFLHCSDQQYWFAPEKDLFLLLPAFTDTTVYVAYQYAKRNDEESMQQSVEISLKDTMGAVLSVTNFLPRIVTNTVYSPQPFVVPMENFASVQFDHNSSNYNFREYQLAYNKLGVNNGPIISLDAYDQTNGMPLTLMNTYIGYKAGLTTLRAGLMNIWGELPIYGQGGNVVVGDTKHFLSATYLNNANPYLFGGDHTNQQNDTRNLHIAGTYEFSPQFAMSALFQHQWDNPFYKDLYLAGTSMKWFPNANQVIEASLYGSTAETQAGHQQGGAVRLRWSGRKRRWQWFSDNYYSSPDYAGLLKQTKQLSEFLTYKFSDLDQSTGITFSASYFDSNPYFYDLNGVKYNNLQVNNQYGFSVFKQVGNAMFRISPYYALQQMQLGNSTTYSLEGLYTNFEATYSKPSFMVHGSLITAWQYKQNVSYSNNDNMLPLRAQLQAQWKYFFLQGLYQYKAFFASDLSTESAFGKPYSLYSISPGMRIPFWHHRVDFSTNYNLQYFNNNAQPLQYVSSGVVVNVLYNWQLTGAMTYTFVNGYSFNDVRVGVRFLFRRPSDFVARKKTMIFFNDANKNGRRDAGEPVIPGVLYGNDQMMAQSDRYGKIRVSQHISPADNLSLMNGNGYMPLDNADNFRFKKKSKKYVPMYKLGSVSGKLHLELPQYYKRTIDMNGLPLIFTNEAGQSFTCYVQADSSYSISLPAGNYEINVSKELQDNYQLLQKQSIKVNAEETQQLNFDIKYKAPKPAEIIHFTGKR